MDFKDLLVYKKAYNLAMEIYRLSKHFPKEEKYSLTDQIRISSRSTCANLEEAYRKRIYPKHFISELTDADGENSETAVWLSFAMHCEYIKKSEFNQLNSETKEVGKLINFMINNPDKFGSTKL